VLVVFLVALAVMVARQQMEDSSWIPQGADWDTWYQSAAAITHSGIQYPPNRWPAYGLVGALFGILPGPLHVNLAVASLAASAGAIAGIFLIGRTLLGLPGAVAAAALTLTFPIVAELGSWTSAYPLWATAAIWTVAGMVEALHSGRRGWWYVAGAGAAMVMAVMAKGLGIGLVLLGIIALSSLLDGRRCLGNLGRVALPILLLSAIYLAFPSPLVTLRAQIAMQTPDLGPPPDARAPTARGNETKNQPERAARTQPTGTPTIADTSLGPTERSELFENGYIFGRSMNPWRIYETLNQNRQATTNQGRRFRDSIGRLTRLFPTADRNLQGWLLAGGAAGLLGSLLYLLWTGRRGWARAAAPLAGWLGLLGIIVGVLPSLLSLFTARFFTPVYFILPFFFVAPVALLTRWTRWLSWLPLVLVPLAIIPSTPWTDSPWLHGDAVRSELKAVETRVEEGVLVWYSLRQEFPDAHIYVTTAINQGILALQGRSGRLATVDPRFLTPSDAQPSASDYILTSHGRMRGKSMTGPGGSDCAGYEPSLLAPNFCAGRPVARRFEWSTLEITLYGPGVTP